MKKYGIKTSIEYLKGVGPNRAKLLKEELGVHTFEDLLYFFPFRYVDKSKVHKVEEIVPDTTEVQLIGTVNQFSHSGFKNRKRLQAVFTDETDSINLLWFNNHKWVQDNINPNEKYVIFGKPKLFKQEITITHPEIEKLSSFNKNKNKRIIPVYHSTEKLQRSKVTNKTMIGLVSTLLDILKGTIKETLSEYTRAKFGLLNLENALFQLHFPTDAIHLKQANYRLKFEELFFFQLYRMQKKAIRNTKTKGILFQKVGNNFNQFYNEILSFKLTGAQKKVLKEIRKDTGSGRQMNRLLQGDVGSGKTIVALMSMLLAIDNGFQTALLVPTEILAQQHASSLGKLCEDLGIPVFLLTGSSTKNEKRDIRTKLRTGYAKIIVGTHALLEDNIQFLNLGLAIIDEQHKFGVEQRSKLWRKNTPPPHMLFMSATPIPRTLAKTFFGDLDVSVIDELPPGRKEIVTTHRFDKSRLAVFSFIKSEIERGRQVYVVYPLIEESSSLDLKDVMDGFESLSRYFPLPNFRIGIVHGRMNNEEKELHMKEFVEGKTNILVSTTVIEVGVNVPNASVMVIENAERFGLSQLHQLRGRVGRGGEQSYCILMSKNALSENAARRIEAMTSTNDGFKIAEIDLKIRGHGDLLGTQQSGEMNFKLADITKDSDIAEESRGAVIELLENDPLLQKSENFLTTQKLSDYIKQKEIWGQIG